MKSNEAEKPSEKNIEGFDHLPFHSVVMNTDDTERYMNIRADTLFWEGARGSNMSFLYPAIYTVTCRLNIRYFPYDQQVHRP